MPKLLSLLLLLNSMTIYQAIHAQGWVAEIDLDFNHNLYAYEKISSARFSWSGTTASGSSPVSTLHLVLTGTGAISGDMHLEINGLAFDPYYPNDPYEEPISATFSGTFTDLCTPGFFEAEGESSMEQVYVWIKVYPRMEISEFTNACDELSLLTATCSDRFIWEVSENISGGYRIIQGKSTSAITVSRDDLDALGFADPSGRKYFRVTGRGGTTSLLQPIDIAYPPPAIAVTASPPKCHDGTDGAMQVDIASPNPSVINDFVITLFPETIGGEVKQVSLNDGFAVSFSGLSAGNYHLRVENNSNKALHGACWTEVPVEPLINPPAVTITGLVASDFNGYEVSCYNNRDGALRAFASGGTGVFDEYYWMPDVSSTDRAENLGEGTYQVKVRDSHGCWSAALSRTLRAPAPLSATLISTGGRNGYDVSCHDRNDGALEANISGGVPGYSYAWSDSTTAANLTNRGPGTYQLRVVDANGCAASGSATLIAPEPIDFSIAEISGILCPGDRSGILEIQSPSHTIGEVYYSWSTGESGKEVANKAAGTYAATVSDDQGCTTTRYHTLAEPPSWSVDIVPVSDFHGSAIRCNGERNGARAAVVKDADRNIVEADYYTWYKNGEFLLGGPADPEPYQLAAGTYGVEITYRTFCKVANTYVLEEPAPVAAEIMNASNYNGAPISCFGAADGSLSVTAGGGTGSIYTYKWQGGETTPILTGLPAGTYTVSARDINGCAGVAKKILSDPPPVRATLTVASNFNSQPLSCAGASDAQLKGVATGGVSGYTYEWNTGNAGQLLDGIPAGEYVLTVMDANGCTGISDTTLMDPAPVRTAILSSSDYHAYGVSCFGARDGSLLAGASGGTGRYLYQWDGAPHSDAQYHNLKAGAYAVTAMDENGCSATAQGTISSPSPLILDAAEITDVSCHNGANGSLELTASGGAGGYTYFLQEPGGQAGSLFDGLRAGMYLAAVQDANGCRQEITEEIRGPSPISIAFQDLEPALCGEARGEASVIVEGGAGSYRYEWRNSDHQLMSQDAQLSRVPPGIFTLKVTDEHLCEAVASVGIVAMDGPRVTTENTSDVTCHDARDGSALLLAEGNGPFSFQWQDGQTTAHAVNLEKGNHLAEITDANNCITVASVNIGAPDSMMIDIVEQYEPFCPGDCNGKIIVAAQGGNGDYSYDWGHAPGPGATGLCAGLYRVTATDEKGCHAERTLSLGEPSPLEARVIAALPPSCPGGCDGSLELSTSGGTGVLSVEWSNGVIGSHITNLCAGTFVATIADAHECKTTETFVLQDPVGTDLELGGPVTLCTGQTHALDPGAHWKTYSWGSNTGFRSSQQQVIVRDAGAYWLEAVSEEGCIASDTFQLATSRDLLHANFLLASQASPRDTVIIIDVSWPLPDDIRWDFPVGMKRLKDYGEIVYGNFQAEGRYDISMEAVLGQCRDRITKSITIVSDETPHAGEGRLGHSRFVTAFTLYPNPNDGLFGVSAEFAEESPVILSVWNALTGTKVMQVKASGRRSYHEQLDLRPLSAGAYSLRMDYSKGTKFIRFVVR